MNKVQEVRATLTIPTGDNREMSQAVRYYLGQPLALPSDTGELTLNDTDYASDIKGVAAAMRDYGYLDMCVLGPEGSNSHIVAEDVTARWHQAQAWDLDELERRYEVDEDHGGPQHRPRYKLVNSMPDILDEALAEQPKYGRVSILPIVNTVGGMVVYRAAADGAEGSTNLAEILRHRPKVLGVVDLPIEHCLLGQPGVEITDPAQLEGRPVYSHRQALRQCRDEILRRGLVPQEATSTSAAAMAIAHREVEPGALAIAPRLAAQVYGLEVIAKDIGDLKRDKNVTSMVVVANADPYGNRRDTDLASRCGIASRHVRPYRHSGWTGNPI